MRAARPGDTPSPPLCGITKGRKGGKGEEKYLELGQEIFFACMTEKREGELVR